MTYEVQKEVARDLDRMAERCIGRGGRAATSKQCWFLAGLLIKHHTWPIHGINGVTCGNTNYALTSIVASRLIDDLLADLKKAA
jgi:hypothetical protein